MDENVTQLPSEDEQTSDYDKAVAMQRKELLGLWGKGVINAAGYVYAALKLDGHFVLDGGLSRSFDLGSFCTRWTAGEEFTLKGKNPKPLTHKQVIGALATFDEKQIAEMPALGSQLKMQGV